MSRVETIVCSGRGCPWFVVAVLLFGLALRSASAADDPIVVGSKAFPESQLLGEILALMIEENTDLQVDRRFNLGGTMICFSALRNGELDLYPEYTGTGLVDILKERVVDYSDSGAVFRFVRAAFEERYQLSWLEPFGFNNSYALAVRRDLGITRTSELVGMGEPLVAGFHHEFIVRPDGYPGLRDHYGLEIGDVRGLEHGLAYIALDKRQIDVMDAYTTDGVLRKFNFVLLEDDQGFFPPYDAAPLARRQTLNTHPGLEALLEKLAGVLTQERIVELNYDISVRRIRVPEVARRFLSDHRLIADVTGDSDVSRSWSLLRLLRQLVPLTVQHLYLTCVATMFSAIIGISLGLIVARYPQQLSGPVIGTVGVIQTIPSLALLGFLIPLLGIGEGPAIVALFLYGLLPIVRNTFVGITSVTPSLRESGQAMGMTNAQLMFQLELPLATRTIMAGIRSALVINVGTATLAAFIGAGGLGEPITRGLQQGDYMRILAGAIPAALLALACDFAMSRVELALEPRGLRIGRSKSKS